VDTIIQGIGGMSAKARRRSYSEAQRREILEEAARPGVSVAAVARRHGINDNLIYTWRKERREARGVMLPVTVTPYSVPPDPGALALAARPAASDAQIEIRTKQGHVIQLGADVDVRMVQAILAALK